MTRDIWVGASVTDGIHLFGFGEAGPEGTRLTLTLFVFIILPKIILSLT